jgi:hypothetical protein
LMFIGISMKDLFRFEMTAFAALRHHEKSIPAAEKLAGVLSSIYAFRSANGKDISLLPSFLRIWCRSYPKMPGHT